MFGRLLGWYIFGGLATTEFCQVQNLLCAQVLRSPILASLLHGTEAVGVSQTLQRSTTNGITELSLLVIFAPESANPLTEFCRLENSLQMEKLKRMRLTVRLFLTVTARLRIRPRSALQ